MTKQITQRMTIGSKYTLLFILLFHLTNSVVIDYVELSVPYSNYDLKAKHPYRFFKTFGEESILILDDKCHKFSVEEKDIETFYSITGSKELKKDCNYNDTSIRRINKKDKAKFGIVEVLLFSPNQQLMDVKNNIVLQPNKQYIVKSIDVDQELYRIYGENCENYIVQMSSADEIKLENVTTSFHKNCDNLTNINAYVKNIQKYDISFKKLWPLSLTPEAEIIDINDDRMTKGMNDLIDLANKLKSSLSRLMSSTPKTETITRTATETVLSSLVSTKIQPTTIEINLPQETMTVNVTDTETKTLINNYTSTKYHTVINTVTKHLPAITSTFTETKLKTETRTIATPSLVTSFITSSTIKIIERPVTIQKVLYNTIHYTYTKTDTSTWIRPTTSVKIITETQDPITIKNIIKVNITQTIDRNITRTQYHTRTVEKPVTKIKTQTKIISTSITKLIPTTQTVEKPKYINSTITEYSIVDKTINHTQTSTLTRYKTIEKLKPTTISVTVKDTVSAIVNYTTTKDNYITETVPTLITSFSTIENTVTRNYTHFIDKPTTITETEIGPTVTALGDNVTIFFNHTTTVPEIITSYVSIEPISNYKYPSNFRISDKCLQESLLKTNQREKRNDSQRIKDEFITKLLKKQKELDSRDRGIIGMNGPALTTEEFISDLETDKLISKMPAEILLLYLLDWNELEGLSKMPDFDSNKALEWVGDRVGLRKNVAVTWLIKNHNWARGEEREKVKNLEIEDGMWTQYMRLIILREGYNISYAEEIIAGEKEVLTPRKLPIYIPTTTTTENPEEILMRNKEIEARKNDTIRKIEEVLARKHHLENKTFLASSAAFGIQYTNFGNLFSFGEDFTLIMKLEMPMDKLEIPPDLNKNSCSELIAIMPVIESIRNKNDLQNVTNALEEACKNFDATMANLQFHIEEATSRAIKEFQLRQLSRTKRFEPVTMAIGAAAVWGVWMTAEVLNGKHERKELFKKTMELENKMNKMSEKVETLSETFLGYVERTAKVFVEFDRKIEILRNFTIEQGRQMAKALEDAVSFLDYKQTYIGLISVINSYRLAQSNIMQDKMILVLDLIQSVESIYSTLSTGRLSHQLLPWHSL